ncbi:MAG: Hsp20/alpha crystallin family protein [Salinivirgaceae bacterium]|nr:Hsp20/alpha crystallin family protein [Salinivirgaceae bacterium]MDD4747080.1 Hsp20/alpha crystallin family protein [Salinivirgaceae bacterium]
MPSIFDEIFNQDYSSMQSRISKSVNSRVNIIDNEKDVTLELVAPGLKKEDINIDINNDILTVSVNESVANEENSPNYIRREFCSSAFSRSFTLPDYLNQDEITASQENGILNIVIPKREQAISKAPRQISIS